MSRLLAFASIFLLSASALAIEPPREKERWTTLTIDDGIQVRATMAGKATELDSTLSRKICSPAPDEAMVSI